MPRNRICRIRHSRFDSTRMGSFDAGRAPGTWIASNRQTGQDPTRERLVLDVRGASAEAWGEHQTGGGCFFQGSDVGHRVFGQGDAGHACWVGEALRKNHDDGVIGEVISTRSINLVCLGAVFLGQLFHRFLAVPLGLIHDFRVREAQEIDDRTVVCCITFGTPELR